MPRRPTVYGQMLRDRLARHGGSCWLVNTGWSGGSVGDGAERMKIGYTRAMLRAALNGNLDSTSLNSDNCFGLGIPDACPEVPPEILQPRKAWSDPKRYDSVANDLCGRFENNFQQFPIFQVYNEIILIQPMKDNMLHMCRVYKVLLTY